MARLHGMVQFARRQIRLLDNESDMDALQLHYLQTQLLYAREFQYKKSLQSPVGRAITLLTMEWVWKAVSGSEGALEIHWMANEEVPWPFH